MPSYTLSDARNLHDQGCSALEISGITGMKRPLVYYWLGQWGLTPNINRRPQLSEYQLSTVFKLERVGFTQSEIARMVDVPVHQVRYALNHLLSRRPT